jgi:hypothetical protein
VCRFEIDKLIALIAIAYKFVLVFTTFVRPLAIEVNVSQKCALIEIGSIGIHYREPKRNFTPRD